MKPKYAHMKFNFDDNSVEEKEEYSAIMEKLTEIGIIRSQNSFADFKLDEYEKKSKQIFLQIALHDNDEIEKFKKIMDETSPGRKYTIGRTKGDREAEAWIKKRREAMLG